MKFSAILLFILLPFFALCQENFTSHYKIYDTKNQKIISAEDIIGNIANADVLFFGEEHNDSTCHVLELTSFNLLTSKYQGKIALSMQMFETACQHMSH